MDSDTTISTTSSATRLSIPIHTQDSPRLIWKLRDRLSLNPLGSPRRLSTSTVPPSTRVWPSSSLSTTPSGALPSRRMSTSFLPSSSPARCSSRHPCISMPATSCLKLPSSSRFRRPTRHGRPRRSMPTTQPTNRMWPMPTTVPRLATTAVRNTSPTCRTK